jgi:hypothetical protein
MQKVAAENQTAKEAFDKVAAEKAKEEKGGGSGSATPTPQRKAILGSLDDPAEREGMKWPIA